MKVLLIRYEPKDAPAKTLLNHALYGRLLHRKYRGRKYVVYKKGILDETPFYRKLGGEVFVEKITNDDIETLKIFGDVEVMSSEISDTIELITGKEYWKKRAKELGVFLKN